MSGLEAALERTEADADAALKAAVAAAAQLKKVKKAAAVGALRELARALESAAELAAALAEAARAARAGWAFDERAHLESGAYARELLEVAQAGGVRLYEQDDRLVGYPSLVRVLPGEAAIEIDRKRQRSIRPTVVVERLKAAQERPLRFRAEQFLEALLRAYRLVAAEQRKESGATVRLLDVYRILTVLPGQAAAYSRQEFARDVYLLDESGVEVTREGFRLSLPAASGTRTGSALTTVTKSGELKLYYGIAFRR